MQLSPGWKGGAEGEKRRDVIKKLSSEALEEEVPPHPTFTHTPFLPFQGKGGKSQTSNQAHICQCSHVPNTTTAISPFFPPRGGRGRGKKPFFPLTLSPEGVIREVPWLDGWLVGWLALSAVSKYLLTTLPYLPFLIFASKGGAWDGGERAFLAQEGGFLRKRGRIR